MPEMKPPLFCLSAALLFWGWLSGFLVPALVMALLLELAGPSGIRLRIRLRDLNRIADLCVLLVTGAIVYLFFTPMDNDAILPLIVTQWSPMLFYPLALAQAYAESETFALVALLPVLGARRSRELDRKPQKVSGANLLFPYFGLVLLAAGSANQRYNLYYTVLFVLVAWGLSAARPKYAGPSGASWKGWLLWAGLLLACGYIGDVGQEKLDEQQARLRGWSAGADPYHRETSMGSMGTLKLSDKILMRVRPGPGRKGPPHLLREASYNFYRGLSWEAATGFFGVVPSKDADKTDWILHSGLDADGYVSIYRYFPRRLGLVPVPGGTTRISSLPAREVLLNSLGAIKAERADGLCAYKAWYIEGGFLEGGPNPVDEVVPPADRPALEKIAQDSGLDTAAPEDVSRTLLEYIWKHYSYSLRLERSDTKLDPLSDFLLNTRKGHCEYFATAAAMLLRQVGIPSRYVVGYAVVEYDPETDFYIIRERHRHAWAIYYAGYSWHVLDATPPDWSALEYREPGFWQKLDDFRSRVIFTLSSWRWLEERGKVKTGLLLGALALGLVMAVRILRQQGKQGLRRIRRKKNPYGAEEKELPFARVEARLRRQGLERPEWEPLKRWLQENNQEALLPGVRLHYKQRFDPEGFSEADLRQLEKIVEEWLRQR